MMVHNNIILNYNKVVFLLKSLNFEKFITYFTLIIFFDIKIYTWDIMLNILRRG